MMRVPWFRAPVLLLVLLLSLLPADVSYSEATPVPDRFGGVFVTAHDPDFHAREGPDPLAAQHLFQKAIAYVTHGKASPKLLLVTSVRDPGTGYSDPRLGLRAAGFSAFAVADYGSGSAGILSLRSVNFSAYDAIIVASDHGGWLRQAELDGLIALSDRLITYVNEGGGLVALAESNHLTSHDLYGFLPFLVSNVALGQEEKNVRVTAAGRALGLTDTDVNGNMAHNYFAETGGMDVIDLDSAEHPLSLATRGKRLSRGGVNEEPPVITPPPDVWTNPNLPVCGTAPPGAEVRVWIHDLVTGHESWVTIIADGTGNWCTTIPDLPDCHYELQPWVGNTPGTKMQVSIDSHAPVSQVTLPPGNESGWYNQEGVTLILSASDPGKGQGVKLIEVSTDHCQTFQQYPAGGLTVQGDGVHTICYRSTDQAGNAEAPQTVTVRIDTHAPTVTPALDPSTGAVTLEATDDGSGIDGLEVSYDGGETWQPYPGPITGRYRLRWRCRDKAGNRTDGVISIPELFVAPLSSEEGLVKSFALGAFADDGTDQPWTVSVAWGDGAAVDQLITAVPGALETATHMYADNGTYEARVDVTDKDGWTGSAKLTVTVVNVAPTVGLIDAPALPALVGNLVRVSAPFTDPGIRDTHSATIAWGDGTVTTGAVSETRGAGTVQGDHTYGKSGLYTVRITVTDKDGDSGSSLYRYIVVYAPDGGFVTGGGTLQSPTGAYSLDPDLAGKANAGFNAKYHRGESVPKGQTEFQVKPGLNFHSTAYDWLVVTGDKAVYRGSGTINGNGDFAFIVAVQSRRPGSDRIRMKIWDNRNGRVVYDTQPGADDMADPSTSLTGGNVTIH